MATIKEMLTANTADINTATELLKVLGDRDGQYVWKRCKYEVLPYIQSSGTQFINTGYVANANTKVVIKFFDTVYSSSEYALFGSAWSGTGFFLSYPSESSIRWRNGGSADVSIKTGTVNEAILGHDYVTINGITTNITGNTEYPTTGLRIFATGDGNGEAWRGSFKLCSFQIYEGNNLVRDYVPHVDGSNVGLWDNVENKFYSNDGTGTFTYGTKVFTDADSGYDFVVASDETSYPDGGEVDGYWYELEKGMSAELFGLSKVTVGSMVMSSKTTLNGYSFEHGLGVRPTFFILYSAHKVSTDYCLDALIYNEAWQLTSTTGSNKYCAAGVWSRPQSTTPMCNAWAKSKFELNENAIKINFDALYSLENGEEYFFVAGCA